MYRIENYQLSNVKINNIISWWSDVRMVDVLVQALKHEGDPIHVLNQHMGGKWNVCFSHLDVVNLECFLKIMSPLEKLFSDLNAEWSSTIHLVYPSVKVC